MNRGATHPSRARLVFITILMLLLAAIVATSKGGTTVAKSSTPEIAVQKLDLALQAIMTEQPETAINIIVQKMDDNQIAEDIVVNSGGTISKALPIINSFAAMVDSGIIGELSQSTAVKYISLDNTLNNSSSNVQTVEVRVSSYADDAEQSMWGSVVLSSPDLEFNYDNQYL